MRSFIRLHLTYANVMATIAVFVALGGSAFAAGYVITRSSQIKDGAVTAADVKNSSLTGTDVKDGSLTASDFSGSVQGPGPKGDTGATGAAGAPGPLLDVLPSGRTLTGVYEAYADSLGMDILQISDAQSFPIPLRTNPVPRFVPMLATPPSECAGGSAGAPTAAPGYLCVFENYALSRDFRYVRDPETNAIGSGGRRGFVITFDTTFSPSLSRGSWAVTAP